MNMKRIYSAFLLISLFFLLFMRYSSQEHKNIKSESANNLEPDTFSEEIDPFFSSPELAVLKDIEVKKEASEVELNIPADFLGPVTEEDVKQVASDAGYPYAALHEDGSVTFRMSQSQHQELVNGMADFINESLSDMAASEEYPNVIAIRPNTDFTEFTVTTTSETLDKEDSFFAMTLCMYGNLYAAFCGTSAGNVHVEYVNEVSGQKIGYFNSSDLAE